MLHQDKNYSILQPGHPLGRLSFDLGEVLASWEEGVDRVKVLVDEGEAVDVLVVGEVLEVLNLVVVMRSL